MFYDNFDIEDHLFQLLPKEVERQNSFSHIKRKREFIATRILRTSLFGKDEIKYTEIGAPYIDGEGFISISHAKNVVGLAFSKDHPVGLDLEQIREKVHKIKHKFLSHNELNNLNTDNTEEMIKVWSAKEALYKLAGRKKIIFAKELMLSKTNAVEWSGTIINPDHKKKVELNILTHKEFVISFNISATNDRF